MPGPDQTLREPSADGLCDGLQVRFQLQQLDAPHGQVPQCLSGQSLLWMLAHCGVSGIFPPRRLARAATNSLWPGNPGRNRVRNRGRLPDPALPKRPEPAASLVRARPLIKPFAPSRYSARSSSVNELALSRASAASLLPTVLSGYSVFFAFEG